VALMPGTTYYYVARATSTANGVEDANLVRYPGTPMACTANLPQLVVAFTATSTDAQNQLEWLNPATGPYLGTMIRYDAVAGSSACTAPALPTDGTLLVDQADGLGSRGTFTHGALANDNTTYCYSAFVEAPGNVFSGPRSARGRPFDDTVGATKWAFSTGATSMAPPSVSAGALYAASNDRVFYAMTRSASGGVWPAGYTPYVLNAPVQHRVPIVATSITAPATRVAYLGAQDGRVYAIDAATGTELWQSPALGTSIQGTPVGMFTSFGGIVNHVLVGTWNAANNRFHALDATNGTVINSFDNGGGIGVVSGSPLVDYPTRRVYFASRTGAGTNTLWCLEITAGGVTNTCPTWTHQALGDIDGAVTRRGSRLYVGTTGGVVHALNATTGAVEWSFPSGDGPVKGFVFPDRLSDKVYFSTNTKVWGLDDTGTPAWPAVTIPGPSAALFTPGGTHALVGGNDGRLYQLDVTLANPATPPAVKSVTLGDGSAAIGAPTLDTAYNLVYVGSDAGIVYAVQLPLP